MTDKSVALKQLSQMIESVQYKKRLLDIARNQLAAYRQQVEAYEESIYNDRKVIYGLIAEQLGEE
jgi:hypothetical protein